VIPYAKSIHFASGCKRKYYEREFVSEVYAFAVDFSLFPSAEFLLAGAVAYDIAIRCLTVWLAGTSLWQTR